MKNKTLFSNISHEIDPLPSHVASVMPKITTERSSLVTLLLDKNNLNELLNTFAQYINTVVKLHSLYFTYNQQYTAYQDPTSSPIHLYKYQYELHNHYGQSLGQLAYELRQPISSHQQLILQKEHQWLTLLLPLYLRIEKLEQQAQCDHLTGLGNRGYFDHQMERAIKQQIREPRGLTLLLLDLDKFKEINDTWGHPIGDLVLKRFANLLTESIRSTDQAFRLGGDEFALILKPAEPDTWKKVWTRLQHLMSISSELTKFSVGCSRGSACWQPTMQLTQLYEEADKNLYLCKKSK